MDIFDMITLKNRSDLGEKANQSSLDSLQTTVNNIGNASPKGVYASLSALQSAFPTGTTGIFVVTADGHWYYWGGSAWADGGEYQTPLSLVQVTKTGNPVTIQSQTNSPVSVTIQGKTEQSGTGAPTMTNIRPISYVGILNTSDKKFYTDITVTDEAENSTVYTMSMSKPVMKDGSLKNDGTFSNKYNLHVFDGTESLGGFEVTGVNSIKVYWYHGDTVVQPNSNAISNMMTNLNSDGAWNFNVTSSAIYMRFANDYADVNALKAKLAQLYSDGTPFIILWERQTLQTEQLTPVNITASGINTVQAENNMSVIYSQDLAIAYNDFDTRIESLDYDVNSYSIVCFGDSLTYGAGGEDSSPDGTRTNYPSVLQSLSGITAINSGIGGDKLADIFGRLGSEPVVLNNITIPADQTPLNLGTSLTTILGNNFNSNIDFVSSEVGKINPCYISGVKGNITRSSGTFYFTRDTVGTAVTIDRPTILVTDLMKTYKSRNSIYVFYAGQNGGYTDVSDWIKQIRCGIDYIGSDKYIVIGYLTDRSYSNMQSTYQSFYKEFGSKFIDVHRYMLDYGLQDFDITPTSQDTTNISNGICPSSLKKSGDSIHFNHYGYTIIGRLIYQRMKEIYPSFVS